MELKNHFSTSELKVMGDPTDLASADTNLKKLIADLSADAKKIQPDTDIGQKLLFQRAVQEVTKLNAKVDALQQGQGRLTASTYVDAENFYKVAARSARNMGKQIAEAFNKNHGLGWRLNPQSLVLTVEDVPADKNPKGFVGAVKKVSLNVAYVPAEGRFPTQPKVLADLAYKAVRA